MVTSEERMKILKMINDGKINAEEGSQLLSALSQRSDKHLKTAKRSLSGQMLRVRVSDMSTGKAKVNVNKYCSTVHSRDGKRANDGGRQGSSIGKLERQDCRCD